MNKIDLNGQFQVHVGGDRNKIKECVELFKKIGRFAWHEHYILDWLKEPHSVNYLLTSRRQDKIEWNQEISIRDMPEYTLEEFKEAVECLETQEESKMNYVFEQVTMYKTEDGELFDSVEKCVNYQREKDLINLLSSNIYDLDFDSAEEVLDFMGRNKQLFLDYLNNV